MILEKNKKYEMQKIKKFGNLKQNFKNQPEKQNLYMKSLYNKSPRQKSFIINKNKTKRIKKSNDINYTKNIINDMDDMNFLLSSENDPFSRSVIYSNNKKITNNLFPLIKRKKIINDISSKKNPKVKSIKNQIKDFTKRKIGSAHSVKNSNIKNSNNNYDMYNNLNISEDFTGISNFDEKYQLIEDKIIDKNYENDIDNDEMIIGTNKKGNINNSIFNKIQINSKDNDDELYLYFNKNNKNKNNDNYDNNEDDYLINNNFENNKVDFCIMYIDNYDKMINDDMLLLEIQLLYEKILDLQNSYHEEFYNISNEIGEGLPALSGRRAWRRPRGCHGFRGAHRVALPSIRHDVSHDSP